MWKVLALATTFAGNLTIVGSAANMIVVESAHEHVEVGFWDYALRYPNYDSDHRRWRDRAVGRPLKDAEALFGVAKESEWNRGTRF